MPESVDVNLGDIESKAKKVVEDFGGTYSSSEKEPIAFGLMALKVSLSLDESNSNLDPLEEKLKAIEGVTSVEVVDVRRAIG